MLGYKIRNVPWRELSITTFWRWSFIPDLSTLICEDEIVTPFDPKFDGRSFQRSQPTAYFIFKLD